MLSNQYDLNNLVIRYLVPVVGSIGAAVGTVWLLQSVNPLAALCLLVAAILLVVSIVAPRVGLYLLIVTCAYSDLIKRSLIMFGELSFDQISYVLAAAPLIVIGLILSLLTRRAFHEVTLTRADILLGSVAALLAVISGYLTFRMEKDLLQAAKNAVNIGVFAAAAVVAIRHFRDEEDLEKFIRILLLVFLPTPLYALWQLKFGFADFEVEYLRSGLSVEIKQLFDIRPRPFSTLNSAGVLGTLCAGFFVLSLSPWLMKRYRTPRSGELVGSIVIALSYLAGAVGSLVRSSHLVWLTALLCVWCFRSAVRTRYFYIIAVSSIIAIMLSASWIQDKMDLINPAQFAASDYADAALNILTYNDRLNGFINMTGSGDMWSWFGIPESRQGFGTTFSHDPITTLLMKVGVVGVTMVILGVALGLRWIHRRVLALPVGRSRMIAVILSAVLVGWLCTEVLVNAVVTVFPLNVLFWLFLGAVGFLVTREPTKHEAEAIDTNRVPDLPQPLWQLETIRSKDPRGDVSPRRELPRR
jgi:hypothetical protein